MLQTVILGICVSVFAELASLANKYVNGTPLQGKGAYCVAVIIAILAAIVQSILAGNPSWKLFISYLAGIYATSEAFFNIILTTVGLTVSA